jgi:hypothetical protein
VDARQQRVEHPHLMTRAGEGLDHVGPDEAGAAGHKYAHPPRLRTVTPGVSAKRVPSPFRKEFGQENASLSAIISL